MTEAEAAVVLAKAASFSRRTVGEQDAVSWAQVLADVRMQDALDAVIRHYRDSTDWLMPAHVCAMVRKIRTERIDATPLPVPAVDPDDVAGYLAACREGRRAIGDGQAPVVRELPARPVAALLAGAFRGVR